jgi:hypothetical protein
MSARCCGAPRPANGSRSPSDLWATPPDSTLEHDLQALGGQLADPWASG